MKKLNQIFRILILAFLSGICIGIGGTVFLSIDNNFLGALMFSIGLYAICTQNLYLYTGKVGYMINERPKNWILQLFIIWIGNFIGVAFTAFGISITRINQIQEKAVILCNSKINDTYISLVILSFFCGILMFIGVDGYKQTQNPIILFICVSTFIICGFEHCIADMYYFCLSKMMNIEIIKRLIIITVGNTIGGAIIPFMKKYNN